MSRATTKASPKLEHPTGRCNEEGCKGKLKHVRSVAASSPNNPGQEEYTCDTCGLLHIVSRRRWDEHGDVVVSSEQEG